MVKQSKRMRKFNSTGGVKGRLQKGTITNKGKLRKKNAKRKNDGDEMRPSKENNSYSQELKQKREEADFVSESNLGDMDMESFFSTFADGTKDEDEKSDGSESEPESKSDSELDVDNADEKIISKEDLNQTNYSDEAESSDDSSVEDLEALERQMKEEMGKLEENDPEFHEFLQEEDEDLLTYAAEKEESSEDNDDEEAEENNTSSNMLSLHGLEKMERATFQMHGIKSLKNFSNAFKSACHLADAEEGQTNARGKSYEFESPEVFDRLMVLALTQMHQEFRYHLLGKGSVSLQNSKQKKDSNGNVESKKDEEVFSPDSPINPKTMEKSSRWSNVKPILFTFFKATIHILTEAKEPELVVFVLKSLLEYIPFMTPFPRLAEGMLKALTSLWSAPIDSSEAYQVVRLHAFLRIRQLAMTQPFPFIEECLKKLYLAYAQRAKFATAETSALPTLTFMGNCVVELYSLDYHSSYQHAFIYIRQLALHLRTAMQKKTPEALGTVYCWQYLHCLKLWVAVLAEACQSDNGMGSNGEEQLLQSLLFPLSQVIIGTVRLIPSTRYLPLRLHCVRLLQQLAAASESFLPTTSILLDVFDLKELTQPPKKVNKGNIQPLALTLRLRAENPLRTMEELEMCISEVFVLLNREVDLYQYSAGFPEFSVRLCQRLRKFSKETRSSRWRAYAKGCIDLCERYSDRAMISRSKLNDIAPKDVKQLEILKPINTPSMGLRFKKSLDKEKRLEAASRPVQKQSGSKRKISDEDEGTSKKANKHSKKKREKQTSVGKLNEKALDQQDEVEEGINWSDDEE